MNASPSLMSLLVTQKLQLASDTFGFELKDPAGLELPEFSAGAHVTVQVPGGAVRAYSLCGDPADRTCYHIAVKREAQGRGGSRALVDEVLAGHQLNIGQPQNFFGLSPKAPAFLLIAGGIGITPIRSMIKHLQSDGTRPFRLIYLTRQPEQTAFLQEFQAPQFAGRVHLHHDHGEASQAMDLWPMLEKFSGAHVYCCGPQPLMDAVRDMTGHWPSHAVHFESFGPKDQAQTDDRAFQVVLNRSKVSIPIPAHQTILAALRQHQIQIPSSCESGSCGSCKVGLLEGQADHRDRVLRDDEQTTHIMLCVSRALTDTLVLDC
jgi:phthalate 4,5-dioxygenase reductase subunit